MLTVELFLDLFIGKRQLLLPEFGTELYSTLASLTNTSTMTSPMLSVETAKQNMT